MGGVGRSAEVQSTFVALARRPGFVDGLHCLERQAQSLDFRRLAIPL
jgi:hypothetical protein